ncbi:MAG: hypothetical protein QXF76_03265 [Candidatus Anstonellales archaeon]
MASNDNHSSSLADISNLLLEIKNREEQIMQKLEKEKQIAKEREKSHIMQERTLKEEKELELRNYKNNKILEIKQEIESSLEKEKKNYEQMIISYEKKYLTNEQLLELAESLFK